MAKAKANGRKTQDEESSNPPLPPQKVIGGGDTSNPPPPPQKEIGGGETSNPPTGGREEIAVTIEPDLLDCFICTYPLCPPLYQCMNGHVACPSCWSKVQHKCHICNIPVVIHNIALEKVLESAHLPCTYANLGCRKSVSYSQRQMHTDMCEFGPSLCLIPSCAHKASSGAWQAHFVKDHWRVSGHYTGSHYRYGRTCIVSLENYLYHALLGPSKDLFLLVKEPIPNVGNALSLYYIDLLHQDQHVFSYELMVSGSNDTCSVQLNSKVISIKEWKRGEVRGHFLLVPLGFTESRIKVHVLIKKELEKEGDETSSEEDDILLG